jgi:deoxyribose-phosphate aldolase
VELARYIEQTLLRADATAAAEEAHCREAAAHGLFGVCIQPRFVPLARRTVTGTGTRVVTVVAFPLGANSPSIKAAEARQAALDGADEVDMVMAIGDALGGDFDAVEADIQAVRNAVPGLVLKVIVETAYLDGDQLEQAARAAVRARADFVKTSTGFDPAAHGRGRRGRRIARAVTASGRRKASGGSERARPHHDSCWCDADRRRLASGNRGVMARLSDIEYCVTRRSARLLWRGGECRCIGCSSPTFLKEALEGVDAGSSGTSTGREGTAVVPRRVAPAVPAVQRLRRCRRWNTPGGLALAASLRATTGGLQCSPAMCTSDLACGITPSGQGGTYRGPPARRSDQSCSGGVLGTMGLRGCCRPRRNVRQARRHLRRRLRERVTSAPARNRASTIRRRTASSTVNR